MERDRERRRKSDGVEMVMRGEDGADVRVFVPTGRMNEKQSRIVEKLFRSGGSASALEREEWESIRELRASVRPDVGQTALIVRFDCKWVRIDEQTLSFEEARRH
ncbi:MAG: hypothetical protein ACFBQW_04835 [Sphingomonadaceae bacterium]